MKWYFLDSRFLLATMVLVPCLPLQAAGEMPAGLEEALTTHGWSFPGAKPPMHFLNDGSAVDADGAARYSWDLDKTTGEVHLLEHGPKSKDKARITLWFWSNLSGFSWYDSHGNKSGNGSRLDEPGRAPTAAANVAPSPAAGPVKKPAQVWDPANPPSAQLQAYSAEWLEKLTGTLDGTPLRRTPLMQMQTDFQAHYPQATPPQKAALQAALQVCTTFGNLIDAREKAMTSLSNAQATTSEAVGSTRSAHVKDDKRAQIRAAQHDNAFITSGAVSSMMTQWKEQQKPWRDSIQQLMVREKQAELAIPPNP
jgi:hypothetical protein